MAARAGALRATASALTRASAPRRACPIIRAPCLPSARRAERAPALALARRAAAPHAPAAPGAASAGQLRRSSRQAKPSPTTRSTGSGRNFLGHPLTAVDGLATYARERGERLLRRLPSTAACSAKARATCPCRSPRSSTSPTPTARSARSENVISRRARDDLRPRALDRALHGPHRDPAHRRRARRSDARGAHAAPSQRRRAPPGEALPPPTYCPGLYGPRATVATGACSSLAARCRDRACHAARGARTREEGHRAADALSRAGTLALGDPRPGWRSSGWPISLRMLQKAAVPMIEGSHSAIAR